MLPELFHIGPLAVQTSITVYALAALLGVGVVKRWMKLSGFSSQSQNYFDILFQSAVIVILFWKFGHLLFHPQTIWQSPWAIIMLSGGSRELLLGGAFASIFGYFQIRKQSMSAMALLEVSAILYLVMQVVKQPWFPVYGLPTRMFWGISYAEEFVQYHPIHVYLFLLSLTILIWLIARKYKIGERFILRDSLLGVGVGRMLISYVEADYGQAWISWEQAVYLSMIAIGLHILLPKSTERSINR